MATPGLLEITVIWNEAYDVIISINDVTNKILSRDSNYILDVFMWPVQVQFYKDLTGEKLKLQGRNW